MILRFYESKLTERKKKKTNIKEFIFSVFYLNLRVQRELTPISA